MSYSVRTIPAFERHAKPLLKKYPSLQADLRELIRDLRERPDQGTPLGMGCYKIRLAITSKGKGRSGGARVVTCVYALEETVWLLTIFDKSDKATVSDKELKSLVAAIP
jgi:hypothetical protein